VPTSEKGWERLEVIVIARFQDLSATFLCSLDRGQSALQWRHLRHAVRKTGNANYSFACRPARRRSRLLACEDGRVPRRAGYLALVLVLAGGCSLRQLERMSDWRAGGALAYDVGYRRAVDGTPPVDGVITGSLKARGFAAPARAGYAFGFDLAAGGSHPRGFAWRGVFYPVGLGTRLGRHGLAGVVGGVGGSGITGRIPAALELPVEAFATLRLGGRTAVALWVQPAWLPWSDGRDGGAPDAGFTDELRAGLTFRAGRAYHQYGTSSGNGYHLGLLFAEDSGARYVGVTVGYDLDIVTD